MLTGATGWARDQSQAPPVTTWSQHILVTGHHWPHNLSVLFCREATTSTTSAASYLLSDKSNPGVEIIWFSSDAFLIHDGEYWQFENVG